MERELQSLSQGSLRTAFFRGLLPEPSPVHWYFPPACPDQLSSERARVWKKPELSSHPRRAERPPTPSYSGNRSPCFPSRNQRVSYLLSRLQCLPSPSSSRQGVSRTWRQQTREKSQRKPEPHTAGKQSQGCSETTGGKTRLVEWINTMYPLLSGRSFLFLTVPSNGLTQSPGGPVPSPVSSLQ